MKRISSILIAFTFVLVMVACTPETIIETIIETVEVEVPVEVQVPVTTLAGTYIGYSWGGESKGTTLEDASKKIQTIITLDEQGIITGASMLYYKMSNGSWYTLQDGTSRVSLDMGIHPIAATPIGVDGTEYADGTSMFTIDTHSLTSFYAMEVAEDGSAALVILHPTTRYQFEIKFPVGYDYTKLVSAVTVDGTEGGFIPTDRASSGGLVKIKAWTELAGANIFEINHFDHVMTEAGVFMGLSGESTMQELMSAIGVVFEGTTPTATTLTYGRHSNGGWQGNYEAIATFLIGKDATELTSLVDWSIERYAAAVNEDNFFGIDVPAGATKTAQNSEDSIAGATVRMSRESTSFQRALVAAGILNEEDVIKGRF